MTENSKIIAGMSGREVLDAIAADSPLSRVWRMFSEGVAEIDQASRQRHPPSPIEMRRMELQAANRILAMFRMDLK